MNTKRNDASIRVQGEHTPFWRSSTYKEPTWVSLVWVIGPLVIALTAIYIVVR